MAGDEKYEENTMKGKYLGRFIIEILGTPREHVRKTISDYIARLKEDKELDFVKADIAEPEEKQPNIFSVYAELEIWITGLEKLFAFCLDAMPSSVEIIEPKEIRITSARLSSMLNDLQAKLHEVDLAVKQLRVRNRNLERNAEALLQNLVLMAVSSGPKSLEQISEETGVKAEALKKYLDQQVNEKRLFLVHERWYSTSPEEKEGKEKKDEKKGKGKSRKGE